MAQLNRANPNWRRWPYQYWLLCCWKSSHWFHWDLGSWASKRSMPCNCRSFRLLFRLVWPFSSFAERFAFVNSSSFHTVNFLAEFEQLNRVLWFCSSSFQNSKGRQLHRLHGIQEGSLMHHKWTKLPKVLRTTHTTYKCILAKVACFGYVWTSPDNIYFNLLKHKDTCQSNNVSPNKLNTVILNTLSIFIAILQHILLPAFQANWRQYARPLFYCNVFLPGAQSILFKHIVLNIVKWYLYNTQIPI